MVTISVNGAHLTVRAPFNEDFVAGAKDLGGKWQNDVWNFDARDAARVRELCMEWYGSDGATSDTCTLRVKWLDRSETDRAPLVVHGRPVARAFGRDSGAKLGDGVVLLEGSFASGGSVKNWGTVARAGTVALVRDFPRAAAERLAAEDSARIKFSIEDEAPVIDRAALQQERVRLQARLTEIDELLSAASAVDHK